ncbi:MAG: hypothetical protein U0992_17840 [Planctomycetaceae bacterium]
MNFALNILLTLKKLSTPQRFDGSRAIRLKHEAVIARSQAKYQSDFLNGCKILRP